MTPDTLKPGPAAIAIPYVQISTIERTFKHDFASNFPDKTNLQPALDQIADSFNILPDSMGVESVEEGLSNGRRTADRFMCSLPRRLLSE